MVALDFFMTNSLILLLFFILLSLMWWRWWFFGRDPKMDDTIVPYYDIPDNLSVLDTSAIVYGDLRMRDCSALLIQFAIKGYIKIEKNDHGKYVLQRLVNYDDVQDKLTREEMYFLKSLFGIAHAKKTVFLDDLRQQFYDVAIVLQEKVRERLKVEGYLTSSGEFEKKFLIGFGFFLVTIAWQIVGDLGLLPLIVSILLLIIFILFAKAMTSRTKKGVIMKRKILGFKMYLQTAEQDRIKFHTAPKKNPKIFEKFLPYAMVFDLERRWAQQFSEIYTSAPRWFWGEGADLLISTSLSDELAVFADLIDTLFKK